MSNIPFHRLYCSYRFTSPRLLSPGHYLQYSNSECTKSWFSLLQTSIEHLLRLPDLTPSQFLLSMCKVWLTALPSFIPRWHRKFHLWQSRKNLYFNSSLISSPAKSLSLPHCASVSYLLSPVIQYNISSHDKVTAAAAIPLYSVLINMINMQTPGRNPPVISALLYSLVYTTTVYYAAAATTLIRGVTFATTKH